MIELDPIIRQYVKTALWADCEINGPGDEPRPGDGDASPEDLAQSARLAVARDVRDFVVATIKERSDAFDGMDAGQIGHDFLLTRNHHGAGFWDRGLGDRGRWLTDRSDTYGETWLYVGNDGKIYVGGDEDYTGRLADGSWAEACADCGVSIDPNGPTVHPDSCVMVRLTLA